MAGPERGRHADRVPRVHRPVRHHPGRHQAGAGGPGPPRRRLGWWPDDLGWRRSSAGCSPRSRSCSAWSRARPGKVGSLLGIKLAANEHVAFLKLKEWKAAGAAILSERSQLLAVYALTGFANFASVGIQLGGIGAIAPGRRADLAKLGMKALFVGFLATLINAAVAGLLM